MARHSDGLIATTGCMAGEIPQAIGEGTEKAPTSLMGEYLTFLAKTGCLRGAARAFSIPELTRNQQEADRDGSSLWAGKQLPGHQRRALHPGRRCRPPSSAALYPDQLHRLQAPKLTFLRQGVLPQIAPRWRSCLVMCRDRVEQQPAHCRDVRRQTWASRGTICLNLKSRPTTTSTPTYVSLCEKGWSGAMGLSGPKSTGSYSSGP
jgi:hypothetical protein